ncbi:hypothetical protein ACE6H2_020764 [Prunus campanulata]
MHFHSPPSSPLINVVLQSTLLTSTSLAPFLLCCSPHIPSDCVLTRDLNHQPLLALCTRSMVALFVWVVCPPPFSILSNGLSSYWLSISGGCGFATAARQGESGGCSFSDLGFLLCV